MTTTDELPTASTTVARNIRMWMAANRITFAALSESSGIPQRTLIRIAKGERAITIDNITAISHGLEVRVEALLDGVL